MKTKKAALELSIGTIVIIVLAMTMLILGIVFVRNIMCSGIIISDKITSGVESEIIGLFGSKDYGLKCMGEGGQEIKLGDGGRRQVVCITNSDSETQYSLKLKNIESLSGVSTPNVEKWVVDSGWKGIVSPGQKTITVVVLDVPKKVSDTSLKIEIEEENLNTNAKQTHVLYIDVTHVGILSNAVC
ncbi:MAG: hypothetical protein ABIG37_02030 [Nanoarchaeota archaeon]|nr:hypothetical protein [Nanoarchaeota archaeon]